MRVGIDVGGTFTDLYAYDGASGAQLIAKVPSTPQDFTLGVISALRAAGLDPAGVEYLIHGSTIVTNAAIERTFPEACLITTRGFRDFTLIGRYHREHLYDPYQHKAPPFIARRNILEVDERIGSRGEVIRPLDQGQVRELAAEVARRGVSSVAVGLLNSYANPAHEYEIKSTLEQAIPGVFVATSASIPKIRALGRFVTAILRACLEPVARGYLDRLAARLAEIGFAGRLLVVTNNGGMIQAQLAAQRPELMLTSGPASGVNASMFLGELAGTGGAVTMDLGGTSCDVSMIEKGQPLFTHEYEVAWDCPVNVPMLDIRTIGAGGGSIAWIDQGGSIRVGPRSAGSLPGPACYGRGGQRPTVTDANLLLGRLTPERPLGGEIHLDVSAAEKAVGELGHRLGLSLIETAAGIITIVNENMAAAIKQVSLDRGRDPRDFALVCFGGAGAMHAAFLAAIVGIGRVVVPRQAGVFSAFGAVVMDFKHDQERTFYSLSQEVDLEQLNQHYQDLDQVGLDMLAEQGIAPAKRELVRSAQIRYLGQTYEVETPVPSGPLGRPEMERVRADFHLAHEREYGFAEPSFATALVNLRSTAIGRMARPTRESLRLAQAGAPGGLRQRRPVYFAPQGFLDTPVFRRELLLVGGRMRGPAIIDDELCTTVVAPGMSCTLDEYGNLIISTGAGDREAQL